MRSYGLLTRKPVIYAANVSEDDVAAAVRDPLSVASVAALAGAAAEEGAGLVAVCGDIEAELATLPREDRHAFLADIGLPESGLRRVIHAAYDLLGLQTFFTAGPKEVRAWTIHRGDAAVDAAGAIHTDMARGFIRAEIVGWDDFVRANRSMQRAKEMGLVRSEGGTTPWPTGTSRTSGSTCSGYRGSLEGPGSSESRAAAGSGCLPPATGSTSSSVRRPTIHPLSRSANRFIPT